MMRLADYRAIVKALGYGLRVQRYSDFCGVTYSQAGQSLPIGKGLITAEDAARHKDLQCLRMQHKGMVFDGLTRVVI